MPLHKLSQLETPCLVLDERRKERNIARLAAHAGESYNVAVEEVLYGRDAVTPMQSCGGRAGREPQPLVPQLVQPPRASTCVNGERSLTATGHQECGNHLLQKVARVTMPSPASGQASARSRR